MNATMDDVSVVIKSGSAPDLNDLVAGRIWVGDSRCLDITVKDNASGKIARPWVTSFIDRKSFTPMGWHMHMSDPSVENRMQALYRGLMNAGKPDWLCLENGREYRGREVGGGLFGDLVAANRQHVETVAELLGIRVYFTEVYGARNKVIERQFREIKNKFDRFRSTLKSHESVKMGSLEEVLKLQRKVPPLDELRAEFDYWMREVFPHCECSAGSRQGRTRADVFEADLAVHGALPTVSAELVAMMVAA